MPKTPDRLFVRPPWERMMHMHERLKSGHYPNCVQLAAELEICTRTVKRDLDFMKHRLKLPIEYDLPRRGFYYTEAVKHFPSVAVSEAEVFALLVAHKAIAQYHGTPFQRPLQAAFRRLTGQLDSQARFSLGSLDEALSFRPFAPEDTELRTFQGLTRAVQEGRAVRFFYKNLGARQARRRQVQPYHLACIENHWYLFAFDLDRQAMRTFVLTRLSQLEVTGARFKRPKDFDPNAYLCGSFTVYKGKDDYEVVVDFDAWATDLLRGRTWHPSQEFTELPDGCSRLRLRLNAIEEMERWVLSWGAHATVVRPKALAERICTTAAAIHERYEGFAHGEAPTGPPVLPPTSRA